MRLRRAGLLGIAVSFAQSSQGRKLIAQARTKVDTPENRVKARQALAAVQEKASQRKGRHA